MKVNNTITTIKKVNNTITAIELDHRYFKYDSDIQTLSLQLDQTLFANSLFENIEEIRVKGKTRTIVFMFNYINSDGSRVYYAKDPLLPHLAERGSMLDLRVFPR